MDASNVPLNHALISEVIFTNDEAFSDVEIEKAKMILCVCKNAKQNKNIKKSFDKVKIQRHCKYFTLISSKKQIICSCITGQKTANPIYA
jgi:transcriptional regulatory protein LevR